jgi:hypothetical protein
MKLGSSALLVLGVLALTWAIGSAGPRRSYADTYSNAKRPATGGAGCYNCPNNPSTGTPPAGCTDGAVPTGWRQANCERNSNPNSLCEQITHACGDYYTCAPPITKVGSCYDFIICR